jgi:hypothetical protein
MEGHQLEIGQTYAFREKRSTTSALPTVKLLDKVGRKRKLKVRYRPSSARSSQRDLCSFPASFRS